MDDWVFVYRLYYLYISIYYCSIQSINSFSFDLLVRYTLFTSLSLDSICVDTYVYTLRGLSIALDGWDFQPESRLYNHVLHLTSIGGSLLYTLGRSLRGD